MLTHRLLPALLALAALALVPALSHADDRDTLKSTEAAQILKKLDDLHFDMKKSRDMMQSEIAKLQFDLGDLSRRVKDLELKTEVQRAQSRTSFYQPPLNGNGTIRLENRLANAATIIVNDVPYRLMPFQIRELPAPTGTFTIEALVDLHGSLGPRMTRTLQPNQIYTFFVTW